jgi:putative membrane protein
MKKMIAPMICALAVAAPLALSAPSAAVAAAPKTHVTTIDTQWVQAAIQGELAQVQAGELALQKSNRPVIDVLAKAMILRHAHMLALSTQAATKLGITVPTTPSASQQAMITTLQGLSGKAFAQAFASDEATGHAAFITLSEQEIATGTSVAAKAAARYYLPMMKNVEFDAQAAMKALGTS